MTTHYFAYWGKARPADGATQPGWHPLPYHCLDVAAVGVEYLRQAPALRRWMMAALGIGSAEVLEAWVGFCLALHDVGKCSEAFQSQRPDLFVALRGRRPDPGKPYGKVRHDSLGWLLWCDLLRGDAEQAAWFGEPTDRLLEGVDRWVCAVTGHHGRPPGVGGNDGWWQYCHPREDRAALEEFVADLRELFFSQVPCLPALLDPVAFMSDSRRLSWWVAGLAVLADWLGSNADYFPYRTEIVPLADYWAAARTRAKDALGASGVLPVRSECSLAFSEIFPAIAQPSPLQDWAIHVPLSDGPQLHLLEDVTGAGKTEAAVTLTHRLLAAGIADGFFFGLPTMATANAMYGRIAEVYARLYAGDASLALAHGQRDLVEAFAESVIPPGQGDNDPGQLDDTATARCAAWLADHNKRALLAPAGVGTLDQALMAVLCSKHQSLRLLGLFRKVLIVDEVHACDPYMQRILEVLLEFHALAGGSTILLSATLPQRMKQSLLNAFARGRGERSAAQVVADVYPLATSLQGDGAPPNEHALATRSDVCRQLAVHYASAQNEVLQAIEGALAQGRCVCWMRNTVKDALAAYQYFQGRLPAERLMLFHARFALKDRLAIEERLLESFGKYSTPDGRAGKLVIATQVVEQSLDADWDFVVTDLAPIDRILQRAGRLQRHARDREGRRLTAAGAADQRGQPCLWVFAPPWSEAPGEGWFKEAFPHAAKVYANHGQLWLTAKVLQEGIIRMPDDARRLIESVFGEEAVIPPGLENNVGRAEGQGYADTSLAQQNTLKLGDGYAEDGTAWWDEARAPSRLGETSLSVVLARWEGERLLPWVAHPDTRHAWAYSSVRVPARLLAARKEESDPAREALVQQCLQALPGKGKWSVLLVLHQENGRWTGQAWKPAAQNRPPQAGRWCYDPQFGLMEEEVSGGAPLDTGPV